ncbi:M15 family metallopeptidase [Spirosoma oryzicola]|uniref:M15 family metallopeptidase n=1 Tax=Spirosoma oryzicola TaxID=2898794 RepID=UPI001E4D0746|nr:M15 family metallopeptidase [Spirosoma oryzicola]UHG93402.1 M15 family metallopeptidase [Spirosoma oryzicola]
MPSRSIEDLHPLLAYAFGKAEAQYCAVYPDAPTPFLSCTFRSNEEQLKLYNQLTDKIDNDGDGKIDEADEKVTNARPGESAHNYNPSLAFDVAFKDKSGKSDWSALHFQRFAKLMLQNKNITWGGNFKTLIDLPHFELTDWKKRVGKK